MELLSDPVASRGLERLLIVTGAIFLVYLGYRLFLFGVEKGRNHLSTELSESFKIVFSGTGPGLFFMAFGSLVLVIALFTGKYQIMEQEIADTVPKAVVNQESKLNNERKRYDPPLTLGAPEGTVRREPEANRSKAKTVFGGGSR